MSYFLDPVGREPVLTFKAFMANKESIFASLHILMRAITDGPEDAGRRLQRYWYRESRCQVRTGRQKLCAFVSSWLYLLILAYLSSRSVKISVNPWLMNYLPFLLFLCLKNPRNPCNPWLINYLHTFGISTTVVSALQIHPFFCKTNPISKKSNERKAF